MLHLETIGGSGLNYLDTKYMTSARTMIVEEIVEKKIRSIMMIDIASSLNYAKFDEVKDCGTTHEMWINLKAIYGRDDNLRRDKVESLRGQLDQIKMREDENIAKYSDRIKANVCAIKASREKIEDETMVSKFLRTLLPIYAIRVSEIQEMRCNPKNDITLDAVVGILTTFEKDNYDNYVPSFSNLESAFESKLSLKKKAKKSKARQSESEEEDSSDSDLESIEALLARRYPKGKGKYKGKIILIYFSCE